MQNKLTEKHKKYKINCKKRKGLEGKKKEEAGTSSFVNT